jgi:hypothetical protein
MTEPDDRATPRSIAAALSRVYSDREPDHGWQTVQRWDEGGDDPLDQILVYGHDGPVPHWHYIGVGLTSDAADGDDGRNWTFELTARLARSADELHPPLFMANVLQNLARYVAESGNAFGPGHTIDLHGPLELGSDTPVSHVVFVEDPELGFADRSDPAVDDDAVDFLQVVGLTADEAAAKKSWNVEGFSGLYADRYPLLVTRLDRVSLLLDPHAVAALESGRSREGASTAGLAVDPLVVRDTTSALDRIRRRREITVTIGAATVDTLCLLLPLRLRFGRTLYLQGSSARMTFTPDPDVPVHEHEPADWVVGLSLPQVEAIANQLLPRRGTYRLDLLPGVVFEVEPTIVHDDDGGVVTTIG